MNEPVASQPWSAEDLLRTAATGAVGLVVSIAAWYLAAGEDALDDQIRWANLSVGGFVLSSYAMVLWLLRGRRAVGQRRRVLLGEPAIVKAAAQAPAAASTASSAVLVGGAGRRYFHRAECPLAAGHDFPAAGRAVHEAAHRVPCGVCRP